MQCARRPIGLAWGFAGQFGAGDQANLSGGSLVVSDSRRVAVAPPLIYRVLEPGKAYYRFYRGVFPIWPRNSRRKL